VRRILGVVALVAALHVVAVAQYPGERPQPTTLPYARVELFGGYSYGYTDLFNSGDRGNLNGWNASLAVNVAKWLGFVFDGSGFYGDSKIPVSVPKPFPTCPPFCPNSVDTFNVKTRLYSYLVGAQFPWRREGHRLTPFGEVLFGHSAVRGTVPGFAEVSSGLGLVGGAGADYAISDRWALRFKADYFQTRMFNQKQDNLRVSVGVVIRTVHRKKRTLEEENPPEETPPPTTPPTTNPPSTNPPSGNSPQN
jgi:opacity protein-like surface antigen